ncbi:MAG: substrate-binding domain-containing protein [Blautia sp.]|nr:substrate-binding domain-containing protein [Blautia sp.]
MWRFFRYSTPALTTLDIPTEAMGAYAAKTLLQRLNGEDDLPRTSAQTYIYSERQKKPNHGD